LLLSLCFSPCSTTMVVVCSESRPLISGAAIGGKAYFRYPGSKGTATAGLPYLSRQHETGRREGGLFKTKRGILTKRREISSGGEINIG
jgi:hypothetical protein